MATEYYAPLDFMPGADELHGGAGNDWLNGDGGNDKLWGDSGADTFAFDAPYQVLDAAWQPMTITSGDDAVMDFRAAENDKLDLGGQDYIVQDLPNLGVVLTLVDPVTHTTTGHVTLVGIHTFSTDWVVPDSGHFLFWA